MRHNNFYASWFLVQDNHNEWPMRICPATIRSYCILHSLKSFAETNSAKTAKKKKLQVTLKQRTWHGRLCPRYIASGVISYKNSPKKPPFPSSLPPAHVIDMNEAARVDSLCREKCPYIRVLRLPGQHQGWDVLVYYSYFAKSMMVNLL